MDGFDIVQFLTGTFRLSADVFTWPNVLFKFIIPLIALVVIWYTLLDRKLRIIRTSGINFGLAVVLSIFMVSFISFVPGSILLIVAVVAYFLLGGNLTITKVAIAVGLSALIFFGYPYLVNLVGSF